MNSSTTTRATAYDQPRQRILRLHQLLDTLDLTAEGRRKAGNFYRLQADGQTVIVLTHPDYARHVFQQYKHYPKAIRPDQMSYEDEAERLSQLRFLRPHFHRQQLAAIFDLMVTAIDEQLEHWQDVAAQPLDLAHAISQLTLAVLIRAVFGTNLSSTEFDALSEAIFFIMENSPGEESAQLLRSTPSLQPALAVYDATFARVLHQLQQPDVCEESQNNLLAMLLEVVDETGKPFSHEYLRNELLFIFSVGFENIATGLNWSLQRLTQHSDKLVIAQAEITSVLGDELPTLASLGQLSYAGMVLQEALRLHLPLRWLQRRAISDDEIDGHSVPAGALVLLAAGIFHRDPELWSNPEAFEPARFSPENVAKQHPCAWLPFGKGQRFCLGKDFAMMEGKLILAMVLQRFDFAV